MTRLSGSRNVARLAAAAAIFGLTGCPRGGGGGPVAPAGRRWTLASEAPVRGVALLDEATIVLTDGDRARRVAGDGRVAWTAVLGASAAGVAIDGEVVAVAVGGAAGTAVPGLATGLRGEPGAAVVGLAVVDGARRWTVGVGSTKWAVISHVGASGNGFLVTGSFAGTLRVGARTVTSAGTTDGFVAELDRAGAVRSLVRVGGDGPDEITGAAALGGGKIAIAGTFTGTAELRGETLVAIDAQAASADGFVAVLDADGRPAWLRTWGGPGEDTCAGVVALAGGSLAVAGTVRGEVDVAGRVLTARGNADGLVAVFGPDADVRGAWLVGGDDFDGITAVAGAADQIAIAGWFTGALPSSAGTLRAAGVDDAFVALGTAAGISQVMQLASAGPAAVTALAGSPAGAALAVHATEPLHVDGDQRPAGASLWFRSW